MRAFLLFVVFFLNFTVLFSQSIESIKADRRTYLWGEATANSLKKADNLALDMLISQISTEVEAKFTLIKDENILDDDYSYSETVKSVVNTYSNASLTNTERIVISNEPDAKVFRYIKRSEIDKIFEARKQKILGFVSNANMALENLQIADALRYYYWAYTLLRSHPDGSNIKVKLNNNEEQLLSTWLPFQLQSIFGSLDAKIVNVEKFPSFSQYILNITYKNQPVANFDYSYWNGKDWSSIISAKNGLGFVEFSEASTELNEINLKAEYLFEGEAKSLDNELNEVYNKLEPAIFRNSYFNASLGKKEIKQETEIVKLETELVKLEAEIENPFSYQEIVDKFCQALVKDDVSSIKDLFSENGYEIYKQLIGFGRARVLGKDNLRFLNFDDIVQCRGISMSFSFANNTRSFVEDLVLSFDKNNKICDITLGLEQSAINDIIAQDSWSESIRLSLIDFMEHYKTAFALKNLDYINSIFSDDAIIITGWVLKAKPSRENPYLNNDIVKYNHYTKEEYLRKLQISFRSNEFINLKFSDNNIRKSGGKGDVYGLQIQQDYFSSSYGDSGYLFLLIDFNDTVNPTIHVRTWQPQKNPDGSIYGVQDF
ncbi:MAG: hypothetical protein GX793_05300 [Bacteroidales bacterium]|jgi:hypothetical protein|nr:hypothetical protein [Bacteroidales bacterium]NLB86458.1 hypothetical protein [Bacteroidales bacterium]